MMNWCVDTFSFKKSSPSLEHMRREADKEGKDIDFDGVRTWWGPDLRRRPEISGRNVNTLVLYCVTSASEELWPVFAQVRWIENSFLASRFLEISSRFHWLMEKSGALPPHTILSPPPSCSVLPRLLESSSGITNKIYGADSISFGLDLYLQQSHWHQTQDYWNHLHWNHLHLSNMHMCIYDLQNKI